MEVGWMDVGADDTIEIVARDVSSIRKPGSKPQQLISEDSTL